MTEIEVKPEGWRVQPIVEPKITIPRLASRYDKLDPFWAALMVGEFIGAPQARGEWRVERFRITDEEALMDFARAHGNDGKGRWAAGVGDFIKLFRVIPGGGFEGGPAEEIMMSNTPQEMIDHQHPLEHATGRVLVHGLGLSCLVSGLLAKPEVDHIDVVEIDQGIIDMVGPAYADEERVTIHHGDCSTFPWPKGTRWNYVWHDIWANISSRNLHDPEEAENGIPYAMLHRKFSARCDMQRSWAFERAQQQRDHEREIDRRKAEFARKWKRSSFETRVEMLIDWHYDQIMQVPGLFEKPSREEWIEGSQHLGTLDAFFEAAARDEAPGMWWEA